MLPKKKLIDRAIADGSIDRINNLLSAGHILVCLSNSYIQEASDLMFEKGLLLGELKKRYNEFLLYADRYFTEFATLVDGAKIDMFKDMEALDEIFRGWNKISKDWKPKEIDNETGRS